MTPLCSQLDAPHRDGPRPLQARLRSAQLSRGRRNSVGAASRTGRDTTLRGGGGAVHRGSQPKLQGVEAYQFNEKYLTGNAALAAVSLVPSRQFRGPLLASEKDYTMRKLFRCVPYTDKDAAPYHEAYG